MLGGMNNALFLQGLAGYAVVALILIPILKWAFPTKKDPEQVALRKELKKSLRELKKK